jgi:hypothetical protein
MIHIAYDIILQACKYYRGEVSFTSSDFNCQFTQRYNSDIKKNIKQEVLGRNNHVISFDGYVLRKLQRGFNAGI